MGWSDAKGCGGEAAPGQGGEDARARCCVCKRNGAKYCTSHKTWGGEAAGSDKMVLWLQQKAGADFLNNLLQDALGPVKI